MSSQIIVSDFNDYKDDPGKYILPHLKENPQFKSSAAFDPREVIDEKLLDTHEVKDAKIVTYLDKGGFNAYLRWRHGHPNGSPYPTSPASPRLANRTTRYRPRRRLGRLERFGKNPYKCTARLKRVVQQVVVHLDGLGSALSCFRVLHNERGLSAHFLVDNDGTIYQTAALMDATFHAGGVNEVSVGIEIQNRGNAARYPDYYDAGKHGPQREKLFCTVHGQKIYAFDFTKAQYRAMTQLAHALHEKLAIPLQSPDEGGTSITTLIGKPWEFNGFIGHYNIEAKKWDPGPFDFHRLFRRLGSRAYFPLMSVDRRSGLPSLKRKISDKKRAELSDWEAERHFDMSEGSSRIRGHFPVGPLGRSRLWHGGLHLQCKADAPVFAPILGQIVAARLSPQSCPVGSCNFILMRHLLVAPNGTHPFYSLYYHLANKPISSLETSFAWLNRNREAVWRPALERGETVVPNETVGAGDAIAYVGEAGPPGQRTSQIHFAIFAAKEFATGVTATTEALKPDAPPLPRWEVLMSDGSSRLCDDPTVLRLMDRPMGGKPRDRRLSPAEITRFFNSLDRKQMRHMVAFHKSEWTDFPTDWLEQLGRAPDFAALPPRQRRALYQQQIQPTLWWSRDLGARVGLPENGTVYSYHPIQFIKWFQLVSSQIKDLAGVTLVHRDPNEISDAEITELKNLKLQVDNDDSSDMVDDHDTLSGAEAQKLGLEALASGYQE